MPQKRVGASSYTFAEATSGQDLRNWIGSHMRAFESFGGVTEVVVPDNLMGRDDPGMTMRYTHSDLDRRRRTLDKMADRLVGHASENGVAAKFDVDLTLNDTKGPEGIPVSC